MTELQLIYILLAVGILSLIGMFIALSAVKALKSQVAEMKRDDQDTVQALADLRSENRTMVQTLQGAFNTFGDMISRNQRDFSDTLENRLKGTGEALDSRLRDNGETLDKRLADMNTRISNMAVENEQKLENIRTGVEKKIGDLTEDNNKQLEKMRETVDEKLQKTLEDRIGQSFKLVSERLEQVYQGLGEMKTLASGVGDLKKVLSNVKTRGILGEVQLGAILEQILSPEQYEENVATVPGSSERVEFAVKLPGDGDKPVYLPIDSKFPADTYGKFRDAYEDGDKAAVEAAYKDLERVIKAEAKDIRDKYISTPYTTDFGVMFLPFEGLYAEVVNRGLLEVLQRDFKVNIAGPTTMAALLNSLQMGFKTLAIQKHSSQVWEILGAVKTEFGNFEKVLTSARNRLRQADEDLDKLVGTRTRAIERKLRSVEALGTSDASELLDLPEDEI